MWDWDSSGKYAVKSGYKVYLENFLNRKEFYVIGDWKQLWSIKVPPKVRNLMWRIRQGCLKRDGKFACVEYSVEGTVCYVKKVMSMIGIFWWNVITTGLF